MGVGTYTLALMLFTLVLRLQAPLRLAAPLRLQIHRLMYYPKPETNWLLAVF